jgi:RimJ/RimL family protein N-acetyltransferase
MFHRSDRLLLRPVFEEDWQEIHQGINDEGVVRMLANAPWPYREDDAREFAARPFDLSHPRLLVTLPESLGSPVIGCIGLDRNDEGAEMGYWIARPFWGQGFATEAGRALLMLARMMGHRKILAGHAVDNPASAKVLEKLGFRATGEVRSQFSKGRGAETPVARYVNETPMTARMSGPSGMQQAA